MEKVAIREKCPKNVVNVTNIYFEIKGKKQHGSAR